MALVKYKKVSKARGITVPKDIAEVYGIFAGAAVDLVDELAQNLATDLYAPDTAALNDKLKSDIYEQFGLLPEEIQAIGADAVDAFIAGLENGDLSDKVDDFFENFFESSKTAVDDIVKNKKDGFSVDFSDMLENTDTYSVGEQLGNDFADGFNSAIEDLTASVQAEQANVTAEYTTKGKSNTSTKGCICLRTDIRQKLPRSRKKLSMVSGLKTALPSLTV